MITIKSHFKDYKVYFENNFGFIDDLVKTPNALFVIDSKVYELYRSQFSMIPEEALYIMEAVEENKTIDTALEICEMITRISAKRNAFLISIGGGIVQDVTGFVANITYRGINWIFVPTTLLAACDSCIGSKTSLNYHKFKNLLGTFYPPDELHICPEFFMSLSERDFKSGLGEVIKFNIMKGSEGLASIENDVESLLKRDHDTVIRYVRSSLEFKKPFIEADEFDRNERILLNFAHTFGHAIEVVSNYEIPHGTAVAIGMIMADSVSLKRGYIDVNTEERARRILMKVIDIDPDLLRAPFEDYLAAMKKDKKQTGDSLTTVLICGYADKADLRVISDTTTEEVRCALDYFLENYEG